MNDSFLLAGRFGAATRLSPKALRLYAEQGLLVPAHVDPGTGYRYYAAEQAPRARLIGKLRRLGLPVSRIAQLVEISPEALVVELRGWLAAETERHTAQAELVEAMARQVQGSESELIGAVATRATPATKMIYRQRHVEVEALDAFMTEAEADIRAHLKANGIPHDGRMCVLFHDRVTRDNEGLVEVAISYAGSLEPEGDLRLRFQPARDEAFLPVPAAYESFPMVLRVYDAVDGWLDMHRPLVCTDSPLETYPGTNGARFDVAYPIIT